VINPDDWQVEAVSTSRARATWHVQNPRVAKDFEVLRGQFADEFSVTDRSDDDRRWLVAARSDVQPSSVYLYDRDTTKLTFLYTTFPKLKDYEFAPMKPVSIKARDGLELVSYLTSPLRPKPGLLPLILLVHGGPWYRDTWRFDAWAQWLANRGYAVLQVNFRGSIGFGKKFVNAGNKEWGRKMQDDLTDAVAWAVANANIDPKRVGIMGASYGGYATLAGVTTTPDLYAAGVDIVGPSSLLTLIGSVPPYWKPMMALFTNRVGDPAKEQAMLQERSPLNHVQQIKTPLMIFQGANDPRVKQVEADQIVRAIRDRGGKVDYVVYPDEGHGFLRPPNMIDYIGRTEQFLATHLGGRAEPHSPTPGSTAMVK
jgi:dipeptidyl aminopeptidase/acylaminoacyl peptidase